MKFWLDSQVGYPEVTYLKGIRVSSVVKKLFVISVIILLYLGFRDGQREPISHPPGILASGGPVQVNLQTSSFKLDDYQITKKAGFEINARVLSTESYYLSRESDLSPIDLALGWDVMSDSGLLNMLSISQSGRWYRWRYDGSIPVSDQQIIISSANMHMVPATSAVERSLKQLREGDVITLEGFLIDVDHDSGWKWRTSMTRSDTGGGACEIVYVEAIAVQ
jgi:hypothetical protein